MDVSVANPLQMAERRHPGIPAHPLDQSLAAPGNHKIDRAASTSQQSADGGAVRSRHDLDTGLGQACVRKPGGERRVHRQGAPQRLRA